MLLFEMTQLSVRFISDAARIQRSHSTKRPANPAHTIRQPSANVLHPLPELCCAAWVAGRTQPIVWLRFSGMDEGREVGGGLA